MDISDTLAPKSDQLDAVDLLGSPPRIFTVEKVSKGNAEQPVQVHLVEFPRPWRPGVTMRRVLAYCWGSDASKWAGRRVELYCDDQVIFGGEKVGGTRVSRLSHIDGPKSVPVILKKGRGGSYKVDPLPDAPTQQHGPTLADVEASTDTDQLRAMWQNATPEIREAIQARVEQLNQPEQGATGEEGEQA